MPFPGGRPHVAVLRWLKWIKMVERGHVYKKQRHRKMQNEKNIQK